MFYDTEDQARRDGFRACKRCKPDDATFVGEADEVVTRALALLRGRKDGLMVERGLGSLAKEVGVTPSYLCRVFKRRMGRTVGAYMKEFEKEASVGETERSVQLPSTVGVSVVDVETGLFAPATTAMSLSAPFEGWMEGPAAGDVGIYSGEPLDLDFDFNSWFWTEDVPNDSIYGLVI